MRHLSKGEKMKEFGIKNDSCYYVVYPDGEHDPFYREEKEEILKIWDEIESTGTGKIIEICKQNTDPYKGIPYDKGGEILAIVIDTDEYVSASFLRIAPRFKNGSFK